MHILCDINWNMKINTNNELYYEDVIAIAFRIKYTHMNKCRLHGQIRPFIK